MSVPALNYPIAGAGASAVAGSVEAAIRAGRLAPGAALPTVRALAARLRLSPATVAAAYRALRERGLIAGAGRRGTRVTQRPPLATPAPGPAPAHLADLADGNPDPRLLPPLAAVVRPPRRPLLYGEGANRPGLLALAARQLGADGIPAAALAVVGGALDGIERVLQARLRPGDRVAVEDPGYSGVLDLVAALGLVAEPVALDDYGPDPAGLRRALRAGARAVILTPRAQNPTGAALDERRARQLRAVLAGWPDALVVEDDHAGPVAGTRALTLCAGGRERWAVVRSVAKSLGPDFRLAILAGDATSVARVEGRQRLGTGWVSHLLQAPVEALWSRADTESRFATAAAAYAERRQALIDLLGRRGVTAHGRSGLNVWVPVPDEASALSALAEAGFAARAGERYRLRSGPAVRITTARLSHRDALRVTDALARSVAPGLRRTHST
jgi:DNA-binding transcriptional MocR family regulator